MPVADRSPMRSSLFWRTFLLIAGLIVVSLAVELQVMRTIDPPPEQQLAWEVASVVNLTRSALVSAQAARRAELLDALAREEDVRVVPLEPTDRTEPLPAGDEAADLLRRLQTILGAGTRVAGRVNGDAALWVSFDIDGDAYWLRMNLDRLHRSLGPPWWMVASLAIGLSLVGALAISRLVNRPLAQLARAIGQVGARAPTPRLPEDGPSEIAALNRRFNRMAHDLAELEADRALALAGISHDIRTPLTRLRMEIELSSLSEADRQSMSADIERIDGIVGKFVEYARAGAGERGTARKELVDVGLILAAVRDAALARMESGDVVLAVDDSEPLAWSGDPLDLNRMLSNLVENAMRYGRGADGQVRIELGARRAGDGLEIEVRDHGPGVPPDQLDRLLRPFARLGDERSEQGGSGLGLAIVNRLAQRHGGSCRLRNHPEGGLQVTLALPSSR